MRLRKHATLACVACLRRTMETRTAGYCRVDWSPHARLGANPCITSISFSPFVTEHDTDASAFPEASVAEPSFRQASSRDGKSMVFMGWNKGGWAGFWQDSRMSVS